MTIATVADEFKTFLDNLELQGASDRDIDILRGAYFGGAAGVTRILADSPDLALQFAAIRDEISTYTEDATSAARRQLRTQRKKRFK